MLVGEKPRLLTPEEVAQELRVTVRTVYRLVERGQLRATRVGDLYRIHADSLEAFIRGERPGGDG